MINVFILEQKDVEEMITDWISEHEQLYNFTFEYDLNVSGIRKITVTEVDEPEEDDGWDITDEGEEEKKECECDYGLCVCDKPDVKPPKGQSNILKIVNVLIAKERKCNEKRT